MQPTLLLELDSSPGDFGALFDIEAKTSLEMAIRFPLDCRNYIKKVNKNLDILKGMPNPVVAETVKEGQILKMLEHLAGDYQNIIIDTQTVLNGLMLDALSVSDLILLVTDNSIESFDRVLSFNEMLTRNFAVEKEKIYLVVNRKKRFDFMKVWDISKMTGNPVGGFIAYDKNFDKSLCMTGVKKITGTAFYKQLCRIVENGFTGKA